MALTAFRGEYSSNRQISSHGRVTARELANSPEYGMMAWLRPPREPSCEAIM